MHRFPVRRANVALLAAALVAVAPATAQDYPARPVTMVVAYAPGAR